MAIFQAAVATPKEGRADRLHELCGGDDELRVEVEALLDSDERPSSTLERGAFGLGVAHANVPEVEGFTILRLLGEGGMGQVYVAEQASPRREVALKVLRPGVTSPADLRRFERESELLACLSHPGVARVYASGTSTGKGGAMPFFAMELVEGRPLNLYVSEAEVDLESKLELLAKICDATEHAHQRGVLHRDLKPANILVDESGMPRVLDFGVGRFLNSEATGVDATMVGDLIGTVAYMSPEQAAGDTTTIDTRSDVYALGVIAYELVCGELPIDVTGLGLLTSLERIRNANHVPLDVRMPRVPTDIATIVSVAMAPDRERRYASAGAMATDLRRFLRREPILARPASTLYHMRLFARRHWGLVASATGVLVTVVLSLIGVSWYASRLAISEAAKTDALDREKIARESAEHESRLNRAVVEFTTTMFGNTDALSSVKDLTVREWLDRAAEMLADQLSDQPRVRGYVHGMVGDIYSSLSEYDRAAEHQRQAQELLSEELADDHPVRIQNQTHLAWVLHKLGQDEEALDLIEDSLEHLDDESAEQRQQRWSATLFYGEILAGIKDRERAWAALATCVEQASQRAETTGEGRSRAQGDLIQALSARGNVSMDREEFDVAIDDFNAALRLAEECYGRSHAETGQALNNVGSASLAIGDFRRAEDVLTRAEDVLRSTIGVASTAYVATCHNLSHLRFVDGDFDGMCDWANRGFESVQALFGEDSLPTNSARFRVAYALSVGGEYERAATVWRKVIEVDDAIGDRASQLDDRYWFAKFKRDEGDLAYAQDLYGEIETLLAKRESPREWVDLNAARAVCAGLLGDRVAREKYLRDAAEWITRLPPELVDRYRTTVHTNLGHLLLDRGEPVAALEWLESGLAASYSPTGRPSSKTRAILAFLEAAYERLERPEELRSVRAKIEEFDHSEGAVDVPSDENAESE